jgi:CRP/FNR family nitrogen fixation transcriptional regulator
MPITNDLSRKVTAIAIHAKFGASETFYAKDEEIYRTGEPAGRIYEVIQGAVRSYKVLSDGRRQIFSFHLPNDVFGLEYGPNYRLHRKPLWIRRCVWSDATAWNTSQRPTFEWRTIS